MNTQPEALRLADRLQCNVSRGIHWDAAAELGVQAEDGAHLLGPPQDPQGHQLQDVLQPLGGVGVREEEAWQLVLIRRVTAQHLGQVGGEIALAEDALQDVWARFANTEQIVGHGTSKCLVLAKCIEEMYRLTIQSLPSPPCAND